MNAGVLLGVACGLLAACPLAAAARRRGVSTRVATLAPPVPATRERSARRWASASSGPAGRFVGAIRDRRARARADAQLVRELPVAVDLIAVAVGAGYTPFLALDVATRWAPETVAGRLRVLGRACELGSSLTIALEDLARTDPLLRPLAEALGASERLGASVDATLAQVAASARADLRVRAEARARTVPVRLLFPLVFLVLPAFGLLTVVPTLASGLHG